MQRVSDLLVLWSGLAAAARAPGRVVVLASDGRPVPGHWLHPVPTVVVALAGVVRIEVPGGRPYDLRSGEALVVAPGAAHRHAPLRSGAASLALGFDYGLCDLELCGPGVRLGAAMPCEPAWMLVGRMLRGDSSALGPLLALVVERPLSEVQPLPVAVLRMRDRIRSHGLTPITAAAVARAGGLRPSRAWQLFRAHFGCTPRQALERRRCAVAAALLQQGLDVTETARRCGFSDRGTFSRAFRRVHGRSPSTVLVSAPV